MLNHYPRSKSFRRGHGSVGAAAALVTVLVLASGPAARAAEFAARAPSRMATLSFSPDPSQINGCGTARVLVMIDDATGLQGIDLGVNYPPDLVTLARADVKGGSLLPDSCNVYPNVPEPGVLRVSISCVQAPTGGGALVDMTFHGRANGGSTGNLTMPTESPECQLDEGRVGCLAIPGSIRVSGCAPPPPACVGDCDDSKSVEIDELVTGVDVVLGRIPVDRCTALWCDGHADVGCLVQAVDAALTDCPPQP